MRRANMDCWLDDQLAPCYTLGYRRDPGVIRMSDLQQLNVRLPDETHAMIDALCKELSQSQAGVIRLAVRQLARREGVTAEKTGAKKLQKKSRNAVDSV